MLPGHQWPGFFIFSQWPVLAGLWLINPEDSGQVL
jgi:hypothetical protein